jgi:hypothetical protein
LAAVVSQHDLLAGEQLQPLRSTAGALHRDEVVGVVAVADEMVAVAVERYGAGQAADVERHDDASAGGELLPPRRWDVVGSGGDDDPVVWRVVGGGACIAVAVTDDNCVVAGCRQ